MMSRPAARSSRVRWAEDAEAEIFARLTRLESFESLRESVVEPQRHRGVGFTWYQRTWPMDVRRACFLPLYLALGACGGANATFEGGVFKGPNATFRVGDVPGEWHRVDVNDAALAFRDAHGSSILVSGRCDLRVDDVPLVALTNQLVMGTTERDLVK